MNFCQVSNIRYFLFFIGLLTSFQVTAQNSLTFIVKDSSTNELIIGATVKQSGTFNGKSTDENGRLQLDFLPNGTVTFDVSAVGYHQKTIQINFPNEQTDVIVLLTSLEDELEEIIIEGTRSNRSIDNIPTRVEVLTEEIDEAATMDPSKVAHLLTHSTGIQVQQTSATSNTANVRIQGLDGRYTQILRDGFPIYGGFSGSLSVMQIPPLDLRQIEYVKGSASTLYGAGAIAGLINILSKEPIKDKDEAILHLNASHIGARDVNAFVSGRRKKIGLTLLAQRNEHLIFDADQDGFSDMPELIKYNINPRIFFYFNERNKMYVGATITNESRQGGDLRVLKNETSDSLHFYKEKNDVSRITTQVRFDHRISEASMISVRNSINMFNRHLQIAPSYLSGVYEFAGDQLSTFSELSYACKKNQNSLTAGLNFYSDDFIEIPKIDSVLRKEQIQTAGAFVNYTFDLSKMVAIESGLRTDYTVQQNFNVLPRVFALFKWTKKLTTRIGGGMGYRNPSMFNQEAELLGYRNVAAIDFTKTKAEQSYGGNADIGFKSLIGEKCFINFNQMFFFTRLDKPLVLMEAVPGSGQLEFVNANGYTQSYGAETFFKFGFYDFVLFVGYTYTHASHYFDGKTSLMSLTPQHNIKGDLLYALPGKWRIGADYEYKSGQLLSNGKTSPEFWTFGLVIEYTWKHFTFFGNVENYTDVRQTRYESLITAPYQTPQFTDVWAPLDGIVVNAGIKIRL